MPLLRAAVEGVDAPLVGGHAHSARVVTASRRKRAPERRTIPPTLAAGLRTPVEVSPCTRATIE